MSKLNQLSLHEAKEGMIKKKFSSREITQDHIKAIKNCKNLNAFITEIPDLALQAADESDKGEQEERLELWKASQLP